MALLSSIIDRVKPSATLASGKRVAELRAQGRSVIGLNAGQPDFDTPEHIKSAAIAAIQRGETKYTPVPGLLELREAVQRKFARENGLEYEIEEIIVGSGGKQVIANALLATVEEGDEVIIPAPYWVSYPDLTALCGGTPVYVQAQPDNNLKILPQQLEAAISPRTKWLILNSPSNPTGSVYSRDELRDLAEVLLRHPHVWIMSDDLYEHLIYTGEPASNLAAVEPRLRDRYLAVSGVSKAYAMTGWRVGYGAGPRALIRAMATIQSQTTTTACTISQWAAVAALDGPQAFLDEWREIFRERRDLLLEGLQGAPGLQMHVPDGAFYVFPSCRALFGKQTPSGRIVQTSEDFVSALLEEEGVGVVAGTAFGAPDHFRISYAASMDSLKESCVRITRFCESLT